ncbi:MAG: YicC/YloC family endoribonuclease [Gammaproteobacteria bacterium]
MRFSKMLHSMTAFARQQRQVEEGTLCWEVRSLNHRYLEVTLHLPEELRALEVAVREKIGAAVKRGKLDCQLRLRTGLGAVGVVGALRINDALVRQLIAASRQISAEIGNPAAVSPLDVLRWPGVVYPAEPSAERLSNDALALLDDTLKELLAMRAREGAKLRVMLELRGATMRELVQQVRRRLPQIIAQQRARLLERLGELKAELDPARLEQELVNLAQKMDVDEELERLDMHVQEVWRIASEDAGVGRRLDFLMQELNREANTLGSKSTDHDIARAVIELKVLIEQMREQIQNIE